MPLTIDKAISKVPFLADSKNIKKTPLSGGITNLNFRIDADGKSYVIRLAGEDTEMLGIQRDVEYAANCVAGQLRHRAGSGVLHRARRLYCHPLYQWQTRAA